MTLDEVIVELYRLAETREWDGQTSDEALLIAIEGLEYIWAVSQKEKRDKAKAGILRGAPRVWS